MPLTCRQIECVRLIAQSYTRKEIALALGISGKCVEYHLAEAARRLGVAGSDIAAMTRYAIRRSLIRVRPRQRP